MPKNTPSAVRPILFTMRMSPAEQAELAAVADAYTPAAGDKRSKGAGNMTAAVRALIHRAYNALPDAKLRAEATVTELERLEKKETIQARATGNVTPAARAELRAIIDSAPKKDRGPIARAAARATGKTPKRAKRRHAFRRASVRKVSARVSTDATKRKKGQTATGARGGRGGVDKTQRIQGKKKLLKHGRKR